MPSITTPATAPVIRRAVFPVDGLQIRESGSGDGSLHLQGHAAVFDQLSHDLGGFRERITPGAFRDVLEHDPDVHLVHQHDMGRVMARTTSQTLELSEDDTGLRVWASLDPQITYVADLARAMERGDVDQMSFAFTVGRDSWTIEHEDDDDERVIRTIERVAGLYDVSVVAQGAYPQTDASLRGLLEAAIESGRVPIRGRATTEDPAGTRPEASPDPSHDVGGDSHARTLAIARARTAVFDMTRGGHR